MADTRVLPLLTLCGSLVPGHPRPPPARFWRGQGVQATFSTVAGDTSAAVTWPRLFRLRDLCLRPCWGRTRPAQCEPREVGRVRSVWGRTRRHDRNRPLPLPCASVCLPFGCVHLVERRSNAGQRQQRRLRLGSDARSWHSKSAESAKPGIRSGPFRRESTLTCRRTRWTPCRLANRIFDQCVLRGQRHGRRTRPPASCRHPRR